MRTFLICCLAGFAIAWATSSTSSSDPPPDPPPATSPGITGQPSVPNPGDESVFKDPFVPYGIGDDPLAGWTYSSLTSEEKVVADRGRNTTGAQAIHDAYGGAGEELAIRAAAEAAATQLGVELGSIGVVP